MAFLEGRQNRQDTYATGNDQFEAEAPDLSTTGKRIRWTVQLRTTRKLPDEEKGTAAPPNIAEFASEKPSKPTIPQKYSAQHEPVTLEIAQTRSYPESERQETVILTCRNPETQDNGHESASEICWVHLRAKFNTMSFEDFQKAAADVPGLQYDEIALALKMLKNIQSSNEKPFVHGEYGKYLIPIAARYDGADPDLHKEAESKYAIFFSLPYFDLMSLRKLDPVGKNESIYPMRSLLQSHHRLASTVERDRKQAVLKLTNSKTEKKDKVVYLPELWCVIINERTVVTYAPESLEGPNSLFGKTVSTVPSSKGPPVVRYETIKGEKRHFPIAQCKTWVQLQQTIKIQDEIFDFDLETNDGEIITETNWTQISQKRSHYIDVRVRVPDSKSSSEISNNEDSSSESDAQYVVIAPDDATRPPSRASSGPPDNIVEIMPDNPSDSDEEVNRLFEEKKAQLRNLEGHMYGTSFSSDRIAEILADRAEESAAEFLSAMPDHFRPLRRAETIGLTPSQSQRRDFELRSRFEQDRPQRLERRSTSGSARHEILSDPRLQPVLSAPVSQSHLEASPDHDPVSPVGGDSLPKWRHRPSRFHHGRGARSPFRLHRSRSRSRRRGDHNIQARRWDQVRGPDDLPRIHPSVASPQDPAISPPANSIDPVLAEARLRKGGKRRHPFHMTGPHRAHHARKNPSHELERRHDSSGTLKTLSDPIFQWPTIQPSAQAGIITENGASAEEPALLSTRDSSVVSKDKIKHHSQRRSQGLSIISASREQQKNDTSLEDILQNAQKQLEDSPDGKERDYYARIVEKPLGFVEGVVEKLREQAATENQSDASAKSLETSLAQKKEILLVAEKLLGAFAPVDYPSKVIEKYWGAVSLLIVDSPHRWETKYKVHSDTDVTEISALEFILGESTEFLRMVEYIITGVSPGNDMQHRLHHRIPPALMQAFTHLIMFYVYHGLARVTPIPRESQDLFIEGDKCTDICKDLLKEGLRQLIVILHTEDDGARVNYEALESETIVSLVMENLLKRPLRIGANDIDVTEVYSEYISKLDLEVQQYPGVKVFGQIRLLSEELEIIEKILAKQYQLVLDYAQLTNKSISVAHDDQGHQYRPSDSVSYSDKLRKRVLGRTVNSLIEKLEDIRELKDRAAYMQWSARQSISIRAESKEKAILIFTVVTVIFLPLSFVTGYLGMNVEDIRDTSRRQGLFWIIALPITAVIGLAIALLTVGPASSGWKRRKAVEKLD